MSSLSHKLPKSKDSDNESRSTTTSGYRMAKQIKMIKSNSDMMDDHYRHMMDEKFR